MKGVIKKVIKERFEVWIDKEVFEGGMDEIGLNVFDLCKVNGGDECNGIGGIVKRCELRGKVIEFIKELKGGE